MTDSTNANSGTGEYNSENRGNVDYDGFWKDLIERFCYQLLKRAVPELYEKADISKKPSFLDKEFRDVINTADHVSAYFADMVSKISLLCGEIAWVIFHCEAQGPGGGNLSERMNHYRCYIYAHYRREPVALAIITGTRRKNERFYSHSHFGTEITYRYNNLVLAELDDEELKASDNPVDLALYAAKCALKADKEEIQKYKYLRTLLSLLAERGWSEEDKRDLLLFLERIINLKDRELEKQYTEYRNQLTKEGKIVYIPLGERELAREIEQRGIEKGIEKGREEGREKKALEVARSMLADGLSLETIRKYTGLDKKDIH